MAFTIIAALLAGVALAAPPGEERSTGSPGASEPPTVLLAHSMVSVGDEVAPDEVVGSLMAEEAEFGLPTRLDDGIPNYKCHDYTNGCPAGASYIDNDGNIQGCSAGCTGECTYCSGGAVGVVICKKSANDSCVLVGDDRSESCGFEAPGRCISAIGVGGGDNHGCVCVRRGPNTPTSCSFKPCEIPF